MRFHRFFVREPIAKEGKGRRVVLSDKDLVHQIRKVLRMTVGGQLVLLDGSGFEHTAFIVNVSPATVECEILSSVESPNLPRRELTLACALLKKNKMELVLQKGTELGVSRFLPFVAERSEKKGFNRERMMAIVREAVEQSERALVPVVREPVAFEDIFAEMRDTHIFFFHPGAKDTNEQVRGADWPACIMVGPEGGFTPAEAKYATQEGAHVSSLGSGVLRAETAAIAASALFLL